MHFRTATQIREDFLRFFESKQHRRVHSSSLVPVNDPTLLFTNAGMNQFKDVFLGADRRPYTRAATSQKCVRAGGKHNDLENVGFTRRHHTFFEMLGNFSFGDYFKREAIAYAWELLTSSADHCFAIDPSRLYVTIFAGDASVPRDDEAERLWIETGVPQDRIFEMPAKDNFWQMGETGPCGPCSEIFYDLGLEASEHTNPDGTRQDKPFPEDDQRYVEIWNLVFMQFDRIIEFYACPDHPDFKAPLPFNCLQAHIVPGIALGQLIEAKPAQPTFDLELLPRPSIDTGMGLERIACVLQSVQSNYQTDLLAPLVNIAKQLVMRAAGNDATFDVDEGSTLAASYRVIADHARASTFLVGDGVVPSNEGRGYVLRKIIRRAIRHGNLRGAKGPFFAGMVPAVVHLMGSAYPELEGAKARIIQVLRQEEDRFSRTLELASKRLDDAIDQAVLDAIAANDIRLDFDEEPRDPIIRRSLELGLLKRNGVKPVLGGEASFRLYETYGLQLDFMVDAARDAGIAFDHEGFEAAKEAEQARARSSWRGGSQKSANPLYTELPKTEFEGYSALRLDGARVLALTKDGTGTQTLAPGEEGEVILDATSFYADSGGQQGDIGHLLGPDHHTPVAEVRGATKPVQGVFAHKVLALQPIALSDELDTVVDPANRHATERNHTGTHLLHAALRQVLGTHVKQAGSLNNATRLRFDFSHFAPLADAELQEIEDIVNREVLANAHVETLVDVPIDEAVRDLGAMALFGEKYGDRVRVVRIGTFSTELCGGTHTRATGEIGLLKLTGESSVSSGIRRIEALSGSNSLAAYRRDHAVAAVATHLTGGAPQNGMDPAEALTQRLAAQDEELKKLRRELDQARMKSAAAGTAEATPVDVKGIKLLAQRVTGLDKAQMRTLVDTLRTKLGSGVVLLGAVTDEGKVSLIAGVTKDLTTRIQAGKLISTLAPLVGGKGGGRPDLAEAGGTTPGTLDAILAQSPEILATLLT